MMEIQSYSTPRTVLYDDTKLSSYFWQGQRLNLGPQTGKPGKSSPVELQAQPLTLF